MYIFPSETEFVHGSGMQVFDKYICLFYKLSKNLLSVGSSGVESQ